MAKTFEFKSIGKKHYDEFAFFKFLVQQEFLHNSNRAINWCTFFELTVTVQSLDTEVVSFAEKILSKNIETNTGYFYINNNVNN